MCISSIQCERRFGGSAARALNENFHAKLSRVGSSRQATVARRTLGAGTWRAPVGSYGEQLWTATWRERAPGEGLVTVSNYRQGFEVLRR